MTTRLAYYGQDVLTDCPENILRIDPQDSAFFVDECGHEEFADGDYPVFGLGGCAAMRANIELAIRISRTTMKHAAVIAAVGPSENESYVLEKGGIFHFSCQSLSLSSLDHRIWFWVAV